LKIKNLLKEVLSQKEIKRAEEDLEHSAVLLPLYQKGEEYYLVFTRRTERVKYHKGQISFPGGVAEPGEEFKDTALREAWEEIGLRPKDVEILGELDETVTGVSHYIISPFVAVIPYPYQFKPNPEEVAGIIEVPLSVLQDREKFKEESELQQDEPTPAWFYEYEGNVIQGATARILKHFLDLYQSIERKF
jgi:8-oxo-dGTP pyrophosphatase MutT (NUDIX family)